MFRVSEACAFRAADAVITDHTAGIWLFEIPFDGVAGEPERLSAAERAQRWGPAKGARRAGERQWAAALPRRGRAADEYAGAEPLRRILARFDAHKGSARPAP
eukprot:gene2533-3945_t